MPDPLPVAGQSWQRTTNQLESDWGTLKRRRRQTHSRGKLTPDFQSLPEEYPLVRNLDNETYLQVVLGGTLDTLPAKLAETSRAAGSFAAIGVLDVRSAAGLSISRYRRLLVTFMGAISMHQVARSTDNVLTVSIPTLRSSSGQRNPPTLRVIENRPDDARLPRVEAAEAALAEKTFLQRVQHLLILFSPTGWTAEVRDLVMGQAGSPCQEPLVRVVLFDPAGQVLIPG